MAAGVTKAIMKVVKKIIFVFLLIIFLCLSNNLVFAQENNQEKEFETKYQITYTVTSNALVAVDQVIEIKNLLSKIYVSQYSLMIGSNNVNNVSVWDDFGTLKPQIETGTNYTKIYIEFSEKVVGKDKKNNLHIHYETPDFAIKKGQILEVTIPSLANKEALDDYQIKLVVPASFGPHSFILPQPDQHEINNNFESFYFGHKKLLGFQGITAAFGNAQLFDFTFVYYLKNNNKFPGLTEISLPSDTPFQRVYYQSLEPKPKEIKIDADNNWLAVYRLEKDQGLKVTATGSAEVYINAQEELIPLPLENDLVGNYLQPDEYWEVDNPEIVKLAEELKTPEAIYNFLVDNLIYDYGRLNSEIKRLGAAQTLQNKQSALCTEFADLFIAIARAAGIPAREIDGYAFTNNPQLRPLSLSKDILHAWVEYYDFDKKLWIPIDPTWGNTTGGVDFFNKLDLNHFAFARHGIESDYPPPAGAYSLDSQTKTIFIDFGEPRNHKSAVSFESGLPKYTMSGSPIRGSIILRNIGEAAYHQKQAVVSHENNSFPHETSVLPPFGSYRIPVSLNTKILENKRYLIEVSYAGENSSFTVEVVPFYRYLPVILSQFFVNLMSKIQLSLPF